MELALLCYEWLIKQEGRSAAEIVALRRRNQGATCISSNPIAVCRRCSLIGMKYGLYGAQCGRVSQMLTTHLVSSRQQRRDAINVFHIRALHSGFSCTKKTYTRTRLIALPFHLAGRNEWTNALELITGQRHCAIGAGKVTDGGLMKRRLPPTPAPVLQCCSCGLPQHG